MLPCKFWFMPAQLWFGSFVIMLLNLDDEKPLNSLRYLYAVGGVLGLTLLAQTFFIFYAVKKTPLNPVETPDSGLTMSIGKAMYTEYLLPVEIVGILLLMAIVGSVVMTRRLNQPPIELVNAKEDLDNYQERNDY